MCGKLFDLTPLPNTEIDRVIKGLGLLRGFYGIMVLNN